MSDRISGSTRLYAVIGDPVAQVRAPKLVNDVFAQSGVDAVLVPLHIRAEDLPTVWAGLSRLANLHGVLVTVPHKVPVSRLADRVSPAVAVTGSANALRREPDGSWFAENFDGTGFVRGLRHCGHEPKGWRVALIGAGGAGSAIAVALLDAGVTRLEVSDTNTGTAAALVERLSGRWPGRVLECRKPRLEAADLAVNATPLGMSPGDPPPFDAHTLRPGAVVADIVMKPKETELLRKADELGLMVHYGHHMLDQQLAAYREFFGF